MQMVRLDNGVEMPVLGFGVYEPKGSGEIAAAVEKAIRCGYRLIDTAAAYNNERQVGEGIRASGIDRRELFVTSKVWMSDYGDARAAFEASLRRLGLDYLDLYLLHWPDPQHFATTVLAWQAMKDLGRVRALGVSNFSAAHVNALIRETDIRPSLNQVELHPTFIQRELRAGFANSGIVIQSWSPLGGTQGKPLAHPTVVEIARKHGKTPAQVVLRWHLDHDLTVVPKSVTPSRIAENIDVFDFALTVEEIAAIDALDTGERSIPDADPETVDAGTWEVRIEP